MYFIFAIIAIGLTALRIYSKSQIDNLLICEDVRIDEKQIADYGLYKGQPVKLSAGQIPGTVDMKVDIPRQGVIVLHTYQNQTTYKLLLKKKIDAFVYAINGNIVTVEIKLREAVLGS